MQISLINVHVDSFSRSLSLTHTLAKTLLTTTVILSILCNFIYLLNVISLDSISNYRKSNHCLSGLSQSSR